jgi:hypothetical protein
MLVASWDRYLLRCWPTVASSQRHMSGCGFLEASFERLLVCGCWLAAVFPEALARSFVGWLLAAVCSEALASGLAALFLAMTDLVFTAHVLERSEGIDEALPRA